MAEKPHYGLIEGWSQSSTWGGGDCGLGYAIWGTLVDHPRFAGRYTHTSYVVARDGNEIETRNSRYTLGTPEA